MATSIFDEPVRGGYADPSVLGFPGRERLEMFGTRLPLPPYAYLTGMRMEHIGDGTTTVVMPASRWLLSPQGRVPLGMLAALADTSFCSALETKLEGGVLYTTAELSMHRLATPELDSDITAVGKVIYAGADVALTETRISDATGRLVAYGTSRQAMFPPVPELQQRPAELPTHDEPTYDTPDPWRREAPAIIDSEVWRDWTGLDIVDAQIRGELPAAPLSHLIGVRPEKATKGSVVVSMPAHPWLTNHLMNVFGGFLATLADSSMQLAIQTTTNAGDQFAPLDFKVNYLRPVSPDGTILEAHATVTHRGSTNAIATTEIFNAAGKKVAVATGAAMFRSRELL